MTMTETTTGGGGEEVAQRTSPPPPLPEENVDAAAVGTGYSVNPNQDDFQQQQQQSLLSSQETTTLTTTQKKKKRGCKPRSKRNRKRPRSDVLSNNGLQIKARIVPLPRQSLEETSNHDNPQQQPQDSKQLNGTVDSSSSVTTVTTKHSSPYSNHNKNHDDRHPFPRFVRVLDPYVYTFTSHAKARWVGRTILDVYTTEFGSYPPSYYEAAIAQGRILVSDHKVAPTYIIQGIDVLCHCVHRHEPAVAISHHNNSTPTCMISIVGETDTILAVDKPATLPVHPCGGYHQNSLLPLLEQQTHALGLNNKFYTIHRLDRLTSGLTILGKTSHEAQVWGKAIQQRQHCEKLYLARVKGRFPTQCPDQVPKLLGREGDSLMESNNNNKNQSRRVPLYGEWTNPNDEQDGCSSSKRTEKNKQSLDDAAATALATVQRQRNAYGYWFSNITMDDNNNNNNNSLVPDQSLADFATVQHDVETLLEVLRSSLSRKQNNNKTMKKEHKPLLNQNRPNKYDTTAAPKINHEAVVQQWLNLACPVRIAEPKRGVCVC